MSSVSPSLSPLPRSPILHTFSISKLAGLGVLISGGVNKPDGPHILIEKVLDGMDAAKVIETVLHKIYFLPVTDRDNPQGTKYLHSTKLYRKKYHKFAAIYIVQECTTSNNASESQTSNNVLVLVATMVIVVSS